MPMTLYVRNVEETLHRRFKALCVERGETLEQAIQRLMAEELKRAGKEGKR